MKLQKLASEPLTSEPSIPTIRWALVLSFWAILGVPFHGTTVQRCPVHGTELQLADPGSMQAYTPVPDGLGSNPL